jgi:hypothetical protein
MSDSKKQLPDKFCLEGQIWGLKDRLYWYYDKELLASSLVDIRLKRLIGAKIEVTPTGPFFIGAIDNYLVAFYTLWYVFDFNTTVEIIEGEIPVWNGVWYQSYEGVPYPWPERLWGNRLQEKIAD